MPEALPFPEVSARNLDVGIVGQLPATDFPFGDQFEASSLQIIGFEAPFRRRRLIEQALKDRLGIRTTPSYSPTPMPNSTAARSGFQRASAGKRKNIDTSLIVR